MNEMFDSTINLVEEGLDKTAAIVARIKNGEHRSPEALLALTKLLHALGSFVMDTSNDSDGHGTAVK